MECSIFSRKSDWQHPTAVHRQDPKASPQGTPSMKALLAREVRWISKAFVILIHVKFTCYTNILNKILKYHSMGKKSRTCNSKVCVIDIDCIIWSIWNATILFVLPISKNDKSWKQCLSVKGLNGFPKNGRGGYNKKLPDSLVWILWAFPCQSNALYQSLLSLITPTMSSKPWEFEMVQSNP